MHVARIDRDTDFDGHASYRVTLSCGCYFSEYRPINDPPPETGRPATCFVEASSDDAREARRRAS